MLKNLDAKAQGLQWEVTLVSPSAFDSDGTKIGGGHLNTWVITARKAAAERYHVAKLAAGWLEPPVPAPPVEAQVPPPHAVKPARK